VGIVRTRQSIVALAMMVLAGVCGAVAAPPARAASSQVIAAGSSSTNLPTESVWPGAQNPPYVCCWGSNGQFVTFSFTVAAGSTSLAFRYAAGNGAAPR